MLLCKIHVFHLLAPWEMQGFSRSFIAHPDAAKFSLFLISISACHQSETLQSVAYALKFMREVINFPPLCFCLFVMNTHFDGFRCLAYLKWKELIFPGLWIEFFMSCRRPHQRSKKGNLKVNLRSIIQPEQTVIDRCQIIFRRRLTLAVMADFGLFFTAIQHSLMRNKKKKKHFKI